MKLKVLAYTFSVPLLWATILVLQIIVPDFIISHSFSTAVLIGLFIGSLIGRLFLEHKYLTNLLVDNEKILLTYLTPVAEQRQLIIPLSILTDIKLKRKFFLIRDFGSVKFFSKDNQVTFYLLNSDAKQAAQQLTQAYSDKLITRNT